jgi:glutathione S-transferase
MNEPELWQFRFSLYPEKVRWAMDFKGIFYRRHSVLPGPHVPVLLSRFGQKSVPILRHDGHVIKQSAAILDYLEQHWPGPALYPTDYKEREGALLLQHWLDHETGPAVRRAAFQEWLPHTDYTARVFATELPEWQQRLYVTAFPAIRGVMKRDMRITPAECERARALTLKALDYVAEHSQQTGYLIGDHFTLADLCAATILQPTCLPPEYPVMLPQPFPTGWQHWLDRWKDHPGTEYVRRMYRVHRNASTA